MNHSSKTYDVKDYIVYKNTSWGWNLIFSDQDGVSEDITDWTIRFTMKDNRTEADAEAVLTKDVTTHYDATNGKTIYGISSKSTRI